MKESAVSEKKAGSVSAQRAKKAASLTRDGPGVADQPLMSIVQKAGCRDCGPSVQSLAGEMTQIHGGQRRAAAMSFQRARGNRFVQGMAVQAKREPNRTGMPDRLKAGIEALSGIDISDVRVHTNSDRPARLNALAFTQDNQIYLGPGQERHLPHEAWHVVQQKQDLVWPTWQMKDVILVNDDQGLEHQADVMGAKALAQATKLQGASEEEEQLEGVIAPIQCREPSHRGLHGETEVIQHKRKIVQLVWNNKCINGGPGNFNPAQAANLADFCSSIYVNISDNGGTKQAYTYVRWNGWRICVVGHAHRDNGGNFSIPGNCFIPGWSDWQGRTSPENALIISRLQVRGTFPGVDRYPHH